MKHLIADISYARDWLICTCGWEGKALGKLEYFNHRKHAEPIEEITFSAPRKGKFSIKHGSKAFSKELVLTK